MSDPYNLQRFIDAQRSTFHSAIAEIRAGRKQSHWIWFIFPQLAGLGLRPTAQYYAIASLDEASAYLGDPTLGPRLRQSIEAMLNWSDRRSPEEILGGVDAMKLKSSLTLFDAASPGDLFAVALHDFFAGPDERTLALLNEQR